jgi:hypothetical protein
VLSLVGRSVSYDPAWSEELMNQPRARKPLDPKTRSLLEELVGPEAPARGSLSSEREAQLCEAISDAWIDGRIPGFPEDDSEVHAAQRWLLRMDELEARIYGDFEEEAGIRIVPGQLEPVVVDCDKARAAGFGHFLDE